MILPHVPLVPLSALPFHSGPDEVRDVTLQMSAADGVRLARNEWGKTVVGQPWMAKKVVEEVERFSRAVAAQKTTAAAQKAAQMVAWEKAQAERTVAIYKALKGSAHIAQASAAMATLAENVASHWDRFHKAASIKVEEDTFPAPGKKVVQVAHSQSSADEAARRGVSDKSQQMTQLANRATMDAEAEGERLTAALMETDAAVVMRADAQGSASQFAALEKAQAKRTVTMYEKMKAAATRAEAERSWAEKMAVDRAAVERAVAEKAEAQRIAMEKAMAKRAGALKEAVLYAVTQRDAAAGKAAPMAQNRIAVDKVACTCSVQSQREFMNRRAVVERASLAVGAAPMDKPVAMQRAASQSAQMTPEDEAALLNMGEVRAQLKNAVARASAEKAQAMTVLGQEPQPQSPTETHSSRVRVLFHTRGGRVAVPTTADSGGTPAVRAATPKVERVQARVASPVAEKAASTTSEVTKEKPPETTAAERTAVVVRAAASAEKRIRARRLAELVRQQQKSEQLEREKRAEAEAHREASLLRERQMARRIAHQQAAERVAAERALTERELAAVSAARTELLRGCPTELRELAIVQGMGSAIGASAPDACEPLDEQVGQVLNDARGLCATLREGVACGDLIASREGGPTVAHDEQAVIKLVLAARWVAFYRRQARWRAALHLPPVRALPMYHGTRTSVMPAIVTEGFRAPDGSDVKFSTNLARRHATATIFASLNFNRALLHADAPGATFLLLALPNYDSAPIDHAQTTYVFADEAQLLPCYLPTGVQHSCDLAAAALNALATHLGYRPEG